MWGLWLVRRAGGGRWALCYRAHHAFQDGAAAVATLERLLGPEEAPRARALTFRPPRPVDWAAVLPEFRPARRVTWWPALDAPPAQAYTAAFADVDMAPAARAGAPHRGHRPAALPRPDDPRCCAPCTPTAGARTAPATAWRCAPTSGSASGTPTTPAPTSATGSPSPGSTFPCGEPDPDERLDRLGRALDHTRLARLADAHRVVLRKLPYRIGRLTLSRSVDARYTPLGVADLRVRRPLGFAGTPATGVYALPVMVPGQPLFVAWVTHRRRLHVTFLADRSLAGAERLPEAWESALVAHERRAEAGAFTRTGSGAGAS
ncbi:hypothetical protein STANM309S_05268 [Streptomyces tanashiensis]